MGCCFMPKGIPNKRYTGEFKQEVVETMMREKEQGLEPVEVSLDRPYETEHDAMHLLHRLGNLYEPVKLPWKH